eukprot:6466354-Amphidinium_carterae.1
MAEHIIGRRPLHTAAWHGNAKAAMHLLASGADVNPLTQGKACPLAFSAVTRQKAEGLEIAKALISKQADCNVVDCHQMTVLHVVAINQNPDLAKIFLQEGLSAQALDEDGSTPLHVSANWGTSSNISLLAAQMPTLN